MRHVNQIAREALDQRFATIRESLEDRPKAGWIRAIRDALGMSTRQLSERMGVSRSAISQAERSEVSDTIRLGTLRRAAESMGCSLRYVLIPDATLQETVEAQAKLKADRDLRTVDITMAVETQALEPTARDRAMRRHIEQLLDTRHLWDIE